MTNLHDRRIRYAVVGLGHIAQVAVLPAFAHARENSVLAALVSSDPVKLREMAARYGVAHTYPYERYDECLKSGEVDAVYIALPNHMHRDYSVRAAQSGVHVLCEKPMAVTEAECTEMIAAARDGNVRLMVAYRLHFEQANLDAVQAVRSGRIGDPRVFNSTFTMVVGDEDNIRLDPGRGGGTLYDIGVYCINAARYLFADEPVAAYALCAGTRGGVEEACSAVLHFPGERVASFTCSFGAADVSAYRVVGTRGDLRLDPAYEYAVELRAEIRAGSRVHRQTYPKRDQFAPQLVYFSDCVLENREPEPSGEEGLADVRIVEALYRSAQAARMLPLRPVPRTQRPQPGQEIRRPPVDQPETVHTQPPSG